MEKIINIDGADMNFNSNRVDFRLDKKVAVVHIDLNNDTDSRLDKSFKVIIDITQMITDESFTSDEIIAVKKFIKGCIAKAFELTIADLTGDPF